jgi:hypothetical protein
MVENDSAFFEIQGEGAIPFSAEMAGNNIEPIRN